MATITTLVVSRVTVAILKELALPPCWRTGPWGRALGPRRYRTLSPQTLERHKACGLLRSIQTQAF